MRPESDSCELREVFRHFGYEFVVFIRSNVSTRNVSLDVSLESSIRRVVLRLVWLIPVCPLQSLETTLVSNKTLANVSLAVLYATFTIMAIPAPKIVGIIGPK